MEPRTLIERNFLHMAVNSHTCDGLAVDRDRAPAYRPRCP